MTTPRTMTPERLQGLQVIDSEGSKVGKVTTVFLDTETEKPEWASVKTGFFGSHEALVPLANASASDDEISVPYTKDAIKNAPHHDPEQELSNTDEAQLFDHYGIPYSGDTVTADTSRLGRGSESGDVVGRTNGIDSQDSGYQGSNGRTNGTVGHDTVGHDTSGPNTDDAMTRSEEQLTVGTRQVETGRARLRKHIVTEHVTTTVPVSHEEIVVEREPITEANSGAALSGGELTEEEHEVVLHAEQPVVAKETVPVERVRLNTQTVTGTEEVSESVRKEQIEQVGVDGDDSPRA